MPIPNTAPLYIIKYIETSLIDGVKFEDHRRLYYLCKPEAEESFKALEANMGHCISQLEFETSHVFTGDIDINEVFEEK